MNANHPFPKRRQSPGRCAIPAAILVALCFAMLTWPGFLYGQPRFTLTADVNVAPGDQGVTSLNTSSEQRASIQVFGKNLQDSRGISIRFEYDASQVVYEASENGDVLPNGQVLEENGTNPTFVKVSFASLGGRAAVAMGLVGTIHFRTTANFTGTTIRLTLAELGRGGPIERLPLNVNIELLSGPVAPSPDFDGDGRVGFSDFLVFAENFGTQQGDGQYDARTDLDSDGRVGFSDFLIFAEAFGTAVETPSGLSPADQDAFNRLVVGKRIDAESYFVDFESAGRFLEGFRRHEGRYTYANTGANTGTLTQNYDAGLYGGRCATQLTFTSTTTGTLRYTCDNGDTGEEERWQLSDLTTPIFARANADTLFFIFLDTWRTGQTRAYDFQFRKKMPQESWRGGCVAYPNESGNSITTYAPVSFSGLEPNNTYEFRYRYRNSSSCDTGSPGPWSPIAEGTTSGSGSGGGGGGGSGSPDLIVESPSVSNTSPEAGASFTLSATVRNRGTGSSTPTTLRYYRSTNATISISDTAVGTDAVGSLNASGTSAESINLTAPSSAGIYYYGACVESVTGESNTDNNCSDAVRITVATATPPAAGMSKLYWTDWGTDKIQRSDLDGSNVEDLVSGAGLNGPDGLALDVAGGKMYWTDIGTNKIQRANLDGSNIEDLLTSGLSIPYGLTLDVSGGKMYWTNRQTGKIQRANLDGSSVEDLLTLPDLTFPGELALDVSGGKMYWTNPGANKIQRADLDGSNVQDLITSGLNSPTGLALDVSAGKMYWTDRGTHKIQRADLDGSNVQDLITSGLNTPTGLDLDMSGGKMYWTDVDADKVQRANLDGSNVEDLITSSDGLVDPSGLAVGMIEDTPVTFTNVRCSGRQQGPNPNSVFVTIQGTITALRTVVSGTLTGYANDQFVGVYNLSAMSPGQSQNFTITGTISTTESTLRCRISWDVTVRNIGLRSGSIEP